MYGRKITAKLTPGTPLHLYLPGPHRGVWNEEALEASKEIILCEALIDALTFWCAGYRNVTASYGVNGFTDDHRAAFQKHGMKRVTSLTTATKPETKRPLPLAEELMAMGIECFRVLFPKGMDANEYALQHAARGQSSGRSAEHSAVARQGQSAGARASGADARRPSRQRLKKKSSPWCPRRRSTGTSG